MVLRFTTNRFDVAKERPNPINPIPGESLLLWLIENTRGTVELSVPDCEDWGWYSDAMWKGRRYLVGASASEEDQDGAREWVLQVDKIRSIKERLFGRARMDGQDECAAYLLRLLRMEPSFRDVSVDPGP